MQISGNQEKNAHHIILFWHRMRCNSANKYSHVCGSIQQLNSKHTNSVKRCSVFKCGWTINYLLYEKTKTDFDSETSSTFSFTIFLKHSTWQNTKFRVFLKLSMWQCSTWTKLNRASTDIQDWIELLQMYFPMKMTGIHFLHHTDYSIHLLGLCTPDKKEPYQIEQVKG